MSLIRFALRRTAVAALRRRTWAADRVYDSDNTPLSEALTPKDGPRPYIVVFTDTDNRIEMGDMDVAAARRNLSLVMEIGVASAINGEHGQVTIRFPATDAGMEAAIDVVSNQALWAVTTDPQSKWGELFRLMVSRIERIPSVRGAQSGRGVRFAARQLTLVCDVISDPAPGTPIRNTHVLKRFIDLARSDTAAANEDAADMIEKLLIQPDEISPSWEQAQAWLGLTKRGIRAIGLAPLVVGQPPNAAVEDGEDMVDPLTREGPIDRTIEISDEDSNDVFPEYDIKAVHFDSSTSLSTPSLTSVDSGIFAASFWVREKGNTAGSIYAADPTGDYTVSAFWYGRGIFDDVDDRMEFGAGGASYMLLNDDSGPIDVWTHFLVANDATRGLGVVYRQGVRLDAPFIQHGSAFNTILLNGLAFTVGGDTVTPNGNLFGDMADLWVAPGVNLLNADGIIPRTTLERFITPDGRPVDPLTFPGKPTILFTGDAAGFVTNKGTGGPFTLTGALTDADSAP